MDRELQQELRRRLEDERDRDQQRLDEMNVVEPGKSVHNESRNETGFAQAALTTRQRSETLGVMDHLRSRIDQIDEALERLDDGSYGRCEQCQEAIDDERLVSMPLVTRCLDCAEETEAA